MLTPKRLKFRKSQKGRIRGTATAGNTLQVGDYGLMAMESGRINSRQIEAARIAMTRAMKRGGQVSIRIFPHKPYTKKPAEVRMGSGKGGVEGYVAEVKPGRILYEMSGVDGPTAKEALELAASKLPLKTKLLCKTEDPWI
jgi:large subunit ribosomal protein L16